MNKRNILLSLLINLLFISVNGQVLINEFSASNKNHLFDADGDRQDWFELYNAGTAPVNLAGYYLSDKIDDLLKWEIPPGVVLNVGEYLVFMASDKNTFDGIYLHTNFKLTQMRFEHIILTSPTGQILDSYQMLDPTQLDHSRGRMTDGATEWGVFQTPTPGAANTGGMNQYAAQPTLSIPPGFYDSSISVAIESEPNTTIRYTTNGDEPEMFSTLYTGPLTISNTTIIKAKAFSNDPNIPSSFPEVNTYFIDVEHHYPVLSLSSQAVETLLGGLEQGDHINHFEYFDENENHLFEMQGHSRRHGNDSWDFAQRGIRFYVKDYYGWAHKINYQIFPSSPRTDFDVLILKASGSDNYPFSSSFISDEEKPTHMRDAFVQTLSEYNGLNLDSRKYRRCIMYLNGEYYGIYEMRERVDADYTKFYHDQGESKVDMLEYWGGLDARYGSDDDWVDLYDFMVNNDLSDPVNYDYVQQEFDLSSLIDYVILNTFTVNTDWLNWNTKWWRGTKEPATGWRYSLWDMDNTFGLGQNYTGLEETGWESDPCEVEEIFDFNDPEIGHIEMLTALFENEDFVAAYMNRYADLSSTVFSCENMLGHFDAMVAELNLEMQGQIDRWGGSMADWQSNLVFMREQIENKCTVITDQVVDCYEDLGISGPYDILVNVDPPLAGKVRVNTVVGQNYPWNATYFGGLEIDLQGLAEQDWEFDHWEVMNNVFAPDELAEAISMSVEMNDTIVAFFIPDICVGQLVETNITGNFSFCEGTSVTLDAGPGFEAYEWTGGVESQTINVEEGGLYEVTVTNSDGCDGVANVMVTEVPTPEPLIEGLPMFCIGNSTQLFISELYTDYNWSTGDESSAILVDEPGEVTVTVTNAEGCQGTSVIMITSDENLQPTIDGEFSFCEGNSTTVSVVEGFTTFQWSDNSNGQDLEVFLPGTYSVTVSDANGCTGETSVEVALTNIIETSETIELCYGGEFNGQTYTTSTTLSNSNISQFGCDSVHYNVLNVAPEISVQFDIIGNCVSGNSELTALPGDGSFSYEWENGSVESTLTNVPEGTYSVTVTDAEGCTNSAVANVPEVVGLSLEYTTEDISCYGAEDGWVEIQVLSATGSVNFNWADGYTGSARQNLPQGEYSIFVSDAGGCNFFTTLVIGEPAELTLDFVSTPSTAFDGSATVIASGGATPYEYQWNTGDNELMIEDLSVGNYEVTVTDANGCSRTGSVNVALPTATNEIKSLDRFTVFPNPSNGLFLTDILLDSAQEMELIVYDQSGKEVWNYTSLTTSHLTRNIDLLKYPPGTYVLMLKVGDSRMVKKVSVVR